jgi:hypothetical protein
VSPEASSLGDIWPLFGLRIRTPRLELRLPTDDDLPALMALARAGIHPPDEMPFAVPWTRATGAEFERGFLQHHWMVRGAWSPEDWALNLAAFRNGEPVGSQTLTAEGFPRWASSTPVPGSDSRSRARASARRCAPGCWRWPSTG